MWLLTSIEEVLATQIELSVALLSLYLIIRALLFDLMHNAAHSWPNNQDSLFSFHFFHDFRSVCIKQRNYLANVLNIRLCTPLSHNVVKHIRNGIVAGCRMIVSVYGLFFSPLFFNQKCLHKQPFVRLQDDFKKIDIDFRLGDHELHSILYFRESVNDGLVECCYWFFLVSDLQRNKSIVIFNIFQMNSQLLDLSLVELFSDEVSTIHQLQ